ncbi:MAG: hypothetical protein AAB152_10440 [Candidatus Coatesbacteria bacterium]
MATSARGLVHMQVWLTARQSRELHSLAARRRLSLACLIREGIDKLMTSEGGEDRWVRLNRAVDSLRDRRGASNVARRHDRYLEGVGRSLDTRIGSPGRRSL